MAKNFYRSVATRWTPSVYAKALRQGFKTMYNEPEKEMDEFIDNLMHMGMSMEMSVNGDDSERQLTDPQQIAKIKMYLEIIGDLTNALEETEFEDIKT
jgi:hypothetical protein